MKTDIDATRLDRLVMRLNAANSFIEVIASNGQKFFAFTHPEGREVAKFRRDKRGQLWFWEEWHKRWIYVSRHRALKGFHHGGTLHALVLALVDFIRTGHRLSELNFDNHWAYGDAINVVISEGKRLGVIAA